MLTGVQTGKRREGDAVEHETGKRRITKSSKREK